MNRNRLILAVLGGVIGVAVLALAYLNWSALAAKTAAQEGDDETEGLETVLAQAQQLSRKSVYPCAASVTAIHSNAALVAAWQAEAAKLAARGDKIYEKTTPAAFKTFIVADAKRLAALPGAVGGVLVKPDFAFGPFKPYIAEGKMPAEEELAMLQRRWDDVATVVETLANCGVSEWVDVAFKAAEAPVVEEETKRGNKKRAKKAAEAETAVKPVSYAYVFTFTARPLPFVRVLNALATAERYLVVDDFSFVRSHDPIVAALGGEEKKAGAAPGGRRGRRARRAEAQAEQPEENATAKNGIVTDPLLDAPITVTMSVTVHDFRSLESSEKTEEVK